MAGAGARSQKKVRSRACIFVPCMNAETDLEVGSYEGDLKTRPARADKGPSSSLHASNSVLCALTGQVILDPCIISRQFACDAFDVALQVIAQYLNGTDGPDICIYRENGSKSRVLCGNLKPDTMTYGVPMLRRWFRGSMASNHIQVHVDAKKGWADTVSRCGKDDRAIVGAWMLREPGPVKCSQGDLPPALIWYRSAHSDTLDRVGWADAPIHELAFMFRKSDCDSSAPRLNDAWNRALNVQTALGTDALLFYGTVHLDCGAPEGGARLEGCLHYRDGAHASGTFSTRGLLHGTSQHTFSMRCPRGAARLCAKQWVHGVPVGSYTGSACPRLNPTHRYRFCGCWAGTVRPAARPHRDAWFGFGDSSSSAHIAPGRDAVVHIVDYEEPGSDAAEDETRNSSAASSSGLDFQMTIKRVHTGTSAAVGSLPGILIKRTGFCWAHVFDQALAREFAVCFSGPVRWSNFDFVVGGPAVSFAHVDDIDLFGHASPPSREMTTARLLRNASSLSSSLPRVDWVHDMAGSVGRQSPGRATASSWNGGEGLRSSASDIIAVYAVTRECKLDGKRDRSPGSARYDWEDLGNHTNRIVHAAHTRVKQITNAWILACRDAITSRAAVFSPGSGATESAQA